MQGAGMEMGDWDRARWAWVAALLGGISYFIAVRSGWNGWGISVWKTSGVAFLALWAWLNRRSIGHRWIAAVMALGAAGDFLLAEFGLLVGGATFAFGHAVAIHFYIANRRAQMVLSQRLFVILVTPLALIIAWQLARHSGTELAVAAMAYTLIVGVMCAAAWASRFPRYRTGLGAFFFLISDLFIFAGAGGTIDQALTSQLVWPFYFGGQALIAWGVVTTLSQETRPA
jgi:hypothetical protein